MSAARGSGFTLVEVAFAVALLGVITGGILMVGETTRSAYETGATAIELESTARRALDRICERLKSSSSDRTTPSPESPFSTIFVDYQRVVALDAGGSVWGDPERIELLYEDGEADDGVDNDGDGLVDECRVEWVEAFGLANERRQVLCKGVREYLAGEGANGADDNANGLLDERGLSFDFDGERVNVRLTLEAMDHDNMRIVRTVERTLSFRNRED